MATKQRSASRKSKQKKTANQQHQASDFHLTPEQIRQLIEHTNNFRNRVILKLLYYGGLRRHELVDLDIQDIDFKHNKLTVYNGKGEKDRIIPLPKHLLSDLKIIIKQRRKGRVFRARKRESISLRMINKIVADAGMQAQVSHPDPRRKHLNPHLLRHSFARNALHAGVPMNEMRQILGHHDIRTTVLIYGQASFNQVQATMDEKWNQL